MANTFVLLTLVATSLAMISALPDADLGSQNVPESTRATLHELLKQNREIASMVPTQTGREKPQIAVDTRTDKSALPRDPDKVFRQLDLTNDLTKDSVGDQVTV